MQFLAQFNILIENLASQGSASKTTALDCLRHPKTLSFLVLRLKGSKIKQVNQQKSSILNYSNKRSGRQIPTSC